MVFTLISAIEPPQLNAPIAVSAGRKLSASEAPLADMVETWSSFVGFGETSNGRLV